MRVSRKPAEAEAEERDSLFEPRRSARFGFISVVGGKSKNAMRSVSLTERVRAMLEERSKNYQSEWIFPAADGEPMLVTSRDHLHTKVRETLKLDAEFVIHSLRHTCLNRPGESGAEGFVIMKLAGHSSITMLEGYVHPTPEAMRCAVERLDSMDQKALEGLKKA